MANLSRIQEYPKPPSFTDFAGVNKWAKMLLMALEEDAALKVEDITTQFQHTTLLHIGGADDSAIATAQIDDSAITTAKIEADAVTATKINVVGLNGTTGRIVVGDVTDADVITGAINSYATTLIAPGKVLISGSTVLSDWSHGTDATYIDGGDVYANSITATQINALTITAAELAANCVTGVKIQADAVTAPKINVVGLDGATGRIVVADATDANVVTGGVNSYATTLIQAGKVLISGAVNLDDWSHGTDATYIDGGKIYTGSITATQITANTIGVGEVDFDAQLFTDGTTKTNIEAWRHASDVTLIDGGDIYANSVTVAKINSDATDRMFTDSTTKTNIEGWKHATDVTKIDGGDIYTGTVTASQIAANTITASEIYAGTITATEIDTNTITLNKLETDLDNSLYGLTIANNVGIGTGALASITSGTNNIAFGNNALTSTTGGSENVALGSEALYTNATGANNIALGNDALYTNSAGNYNVAVGFEALKVSTVSNNVAVGYQALVANTTGPNNIGIGYRALNANTEGIGNIAIGESALLTNITGDHNIGVGFEALKVSTGNENVALGYQALLDNTSGATNVAIGKNSLLHATTGALNIAIGAAALGNAIVTGTSNIGIGQSTLWSTTSGTGNVAIGSFAGYTTTGDNSVFIGNSAGRNESASNKLYIANSNTATPLIGGVFPNTSLTFTSTASTFSGTLASDNLTVTGVQYINDTANANMTQGLTINQGANDNEILALKSSDVAHGITDHAETDTFFSYKKWIDTGGGITMTGFSNTTYALELRGFYTTDNSAKDTTARAPIEFFVAKKSGTDVGDVGADANIVAFRTKRDAAYVTVFIADEDGDILYDGTAGAYQDHDDVALIGELEDALSGKLDTLGEAELKDKNIIKEKVVNESKFVSTKKKNMLLYGSIRQLNERVKALEARL